jgi:DNA helicase-2/ATP-dependent DNA helicase PcrA
VCVLAGAGTGKTRAITHRIAYGVSVNAYQAASVLAVTFTARAAGEMRQRLRALGVEGVQAKTFHAAALRQLGYFWPEVVGGQIPPIAPQKGALVGEAARRVGLSVDRIAIRDLALLGIERFEDVVWCHERDRVTRRRHRRRPERCRRTRSG